MLLQKLVDYSHRLDMPPTMYAPQPVRYWIELDGQGTLKGIVTVEDTDGRRPKSVDLPTTKRTVAIKAKLLADNAEYVLGHGREDSKAEKVAKRHRAFVDLTRKCAEETEEADVWAVLNFLLHLDTDELDLPADLDSTATIAFRVEGRQPTDLKSVQEFWMRAGGDGDAMQCLVCGRELPAMERLQISLKGIPGDQAGGLALISANNDAFESYGLKASYTSPTCQDCGDRFMKAANVLIRGENTHLRLGKAVYVFWTRDEHGFSLNSLLSRPDPDQVRNLLWSVFGGGTGELDPSPFYSAALTASGARAVVRDWIDTTVGSAQTNLARFFVLQRVTDAWGEEGRPLDVYSLGKATIRNNSGDHPAPWIYKVLMHCALAGGPLPASLLFKAVQRCRLESGVNHNRAALVKMVLMSRRDGNQGEESMVKLDANSHDSAYLCGRLFAELEAVQYAALRDVGANIVDRYYGTASSAPATVFGRLTRGAQPHLAKLRRDRPGAYHALDRRLQDILAKLDSFPSTLTLEEQGMFALGYYHQRASDREGRGQRGDHGDVLLGDDEGTGPMEEE